MKYNTVNDLPSSVSHLSLIQKNKILKKTQALCNAGLSSEEAINKATKDSLSLNIIDKTITKSLRETDISKNAEQMISYEVIYEPDVKDAHGEWMSPETIVKAKENFDKAVEAGLVKENLFHEVSTDSFTIEKTWINEELDVMVIGSNEVVKAGTWVAKVKYNDPNLWLLKKSNIVGGLSIQCSGNVNQETGEITNVNFGIEYIEGDE